MQHFIRRSLYVAVLLVMPVLLPSGSFAWDFDSPDPNLLLKGEYRTSLFESCVQTGGEFDENFQIEGGQFRTVTTKGITTYNGDGTGTSSALVLNMFIPSPFISLGTVVSQSEIAECDLTYTVNPDRSFTQELAICNGTILTGLNKDKQFTLSGIKLQGQIARRRQILSYTNNDTNVVTLTLWDGRIFKRICGRIGTGVRRSVYEHDYDDNREYDYHRDSGYDYDDDDEDKHKHKDKHRDKHRHRDDD